MSKTKQLDLRALLSTNIASIVIVLLLAVPAARPFLGDGLLPTHDGDFHVFRLMALDSALHAGSIYPRLFPDFAFGYGYPVLNFYSPATYYLAEAFHLFGAGYVLSMKLMVFVTFALSGLFMYLLAAGLLGRLPAVFAAIFYLYFPYHLADIYVRGAFAEAAAFALFPAVLWSFQRLFTAPRALPWLPVAGLCTALLVLVHNISAMLTMPVLAAYIALLAVLSGRPRRLLPAALSLSLAAGLSAFFWLPMLAEVKWVQFGQEIGTTTFTGKHLYTLAEHFSPDNLYRFGANLGAAAEYPFGRVQVVVLVLSLAALPVVFRLSRPAFYHAAFFLLLAAVTGFMLTKSSTAIWSNVPVLPSIQYPWRLQALLALSTAFLAASVPFVIGNSRLAGLIESLIPPKSSSAGLYGRLAASLPLLVAIPLGFAAMLSSTVHLPAGDGGLRESDVTIQRMWSDDARNNQIGATWTAEFLPIFVKEERWRIPRPLSGAAVQPAVSLASPPGVELRRSDGFSWSVAVSAVENWRLVNHAFQFPGWRALVDGKQVPTYAVGSLGLTAFDVPAGKHEVKVEFGSTGVRDLGMIISLVAAVSTVMLAFRNLPFRASSAALLALVLAGGFTAIHFTTRPPPVFSSLDAQLGDAARLIGVELDGASFRPGEAIKVKLHWLAWNAKGNDYKVFIHLVSKAGEPPLAQHDGDSLGGFTPASRWLAGELLSDEHHLVIPESLSPGRYRLEAGMYDPLSMKNLPVLGGDGKTIGERALLAEVSLISR